MADIKKLAEELVKLTILEANELKEHLKEEYGIEPAAVAVAATAGAADAADEKTEFTVTLKDAGAQKVDLVKLKLSLTVLQHQLKKKFLKMKLKKLKRNLKKLAQLLSLLNFNIKLIDLI